MTTRPCRYTGQSSVDVRCHIIIDEFCDDTICFGSLDCHKRFCYKTWIIKSKVLPVISFLAFLNLYNTKITENNQDKSKQDKMYCNSSID